KHCCLRKNRGENRAQTATVVNAIASQHSDDSSPLDREHVPGCPAQAGPVEWKCKPASPELPTSLVSSGLITFCTRAPAAVSRSDALSDTSAHDPPAYLAFLNLLI